MKQWHQQKLRESLTGTVPTYSKMQLFNGKFTTGVRLVKILKTSHPPYSLLSFWPTRIIKPKHSRNLPHSTNHANWIRTIWTIFSCFEASKAMEQNSNDRVQTKRTSNIAHSHVNVDRVKILDKFVRVIEELALCTCKLLCWHL